MKDVLCFILLALLIIAIHKYEKKLKDKSEEYQWLLRERSRFHVFALDYENQCRETIEQYFPKHTRSICGNRRGSVSSFLLEMMFFDNRKLLDKIESLKSEYLTEYPTKYESRYGTFYFENYPGYLLEEYETEINLIYGHYSYLCSLMSDQISEMRSSPTND